MIDLLVPLSIWDGLYGLLSAMMQPLYWATPSAIQNLDGADVTKVDASFRNDDLLIAREESFHQTLRYPIAVAHVMGDAHRVAQHKVDKDP
mgnify:CR=1 FL=1